MDQNEMIVDVLLKLMADEEVSIASRHPWFFIIEVVLHGRQCLEVCLHSGIWVVKESPAAVSDDRCPTKKSNVNCNAEGSPVASGI